MQIINKSKNNFGIQLSFNLELLEKQSDDKDELEHFIIENDTFR